MKQYGKVIEGVLEFAPAYHWVESGDGVPTKSEYTTQDLIGLGYKEVVYSEYPAKTIYEKVVTTYEETSDKINVVNTVVKLPEADIIAINQEFWASEYFLIPPLNMYASYYSIDSKGERFSLLHDDYPVLLMGASAGQLTGGITLFNEPDYTKEITPEYLASITNIVTDEVSIGAFLGFVGVMLYGLRKTPTVI